MFIRSIKLKNFKCFHGESDEIFFSVPDPSKTQIGLNILIGENNTGKSTIFEAINFLRNGIPPSKTINDLKNKSSNKNEDIFVQLTFEGSISDVIKSFSKKKLEEFIVIDDVTGKDNVRAIRGTQISYFSSKTEQKILEIDDTASKIFLWNYKENRWENPSGIDADFKKFFEVDFIWADTNPDDIVNFGATKICGKLINRITKNFFQSPKWRSFSDIHKATFYEGEDSLSSKTKEIEDRVKSVLSSQFSDVDVKFDFRLPESDSFFRNTKIAINDGIETSLEEKGSGMQRSVALALLQVYSDDLVKHPEIKEIEKPFFLFIDEPEICLHPKAQFKLMQALQKISATKQLFIATHSPFIFKDVSPNTVGMFAFNKENGNITISSLKDKKWELFSWGISWNQINYFVYDLPTVEFHNELYAFIESLANKTESNFEIYVTSKKILKDKKYIKLNDDGTTEPSKDVTLCTYIRHIIHHSNNLHNIKYTDQHLRESIEKMLNII